METEIKNTPHIVPMFKDLMDLDLSKSTITELDNAMYQNLMLDCCFDALEDNEDYKFELRMHRKKILSIANSNFTPEELRKAETLLRYID